jgi:hypothetical protein
MAEGGEYCTLCANIFSGAVRRLSGIQQLNDVLKK